MSTTTNLQSSSIRVTSGRIQDARFVDDVNVMLAVRSNCSYPVIPLPREDVLTLGSNSIIDSSQHQLPKDKHGFGRLGL